MSKIKALVPMIGAVALLAAGAQSPSSAQEITFKFGTIHSGKTSSGRALEDVFIPKLKEYSSGRLAVEMHYAASVCAEHACGEQMKLGQMDMATHVTGNSGAFGTTLAICDLPYLFKSVDSGQELFQGWFGDELKKRFLEETGFKIFSITSAGGFRQLEQSKKEVRVPEDLKGIKFRVTKSPVESTLIRAWNGAPIPYNWPQTYQGIQTGVVDGAYVPIPWLVLSKMYEVAPYFTFVGGAYGGNLMYMTASDLMAFPAGPRRPSTRPCMMQPWHFSNTMRHGREKLTPCSRPRPKSIIPPNRR